MPDGDVVQPGPEEEEKDKKPAKHSTVDDDPKDEEVSDAQDETKDKAEDANEDEEIGVQDVQQGVREAASVLEDEDGALTAQADIARDVDSFSSKMDGVLQDAGLTRKHVYFCCGGVFVLVILFAIVFFGVKFFVGFMDGGDDIDDIDDVVDEVPVDVVPDDVVDDEGQVWVDGSLYGGILLGTDSAIEGQTGVAEGIDVGEVVDTYDDEYSYQIEHYGKVLNALEVDVNEYLNDFEDRTEGVDGLLVDLDELYEEGKEIISDLEYEISEFEAVFEGNVDEKTLYEEEFFAELSVQDGDDAVTALNSFVEISQEQVDIKAQYKAREKLYELLYSSLLYLNARIDDITYNREALVKGVQVVDVRGSDLELIIETDLD